MTALAIIEALDPAGRRDGEEEVWASDAQDSEDVWHSGGGGAEVAGFISAVWD